MEKQVQPILRFPEFKGEWKKINLGEIMNFKNGVNASKENYGFGFKFINVLDIINNNIITSDKIIGEVNISEKDFEKNIVEYGDILFQRSSETREEVGQSNVYLDKDYTATFGGFVIRGKKIKEFDSLYLHFLLKTQRARKEITTKSGGSTRYNVGQDTLSNVEIIKSPSIPEQQKIADYLSTIDKKLSLLEEKKTELSRYKKAMMQKLFSQEIRFKDENGNDFSDWEEKIFFEIIDRISTGLNPRKNFKLGNGNNYYVTIKNISNGNLDFTNCEKIDDEALSLIKRRSDLSKNDIIMSSIGNIGEAFLLEEEPLNWNINESVFMIRSKKEIAIPLFVYHILSNDITKRYFENNMTGSSFKSIKIGELKLMPIQIPNKLEQQKIADFLSVIDESIDKVSEQIKETQNFKKAMLQQLFV